MWMWFSPCVALGQMVFSLWLQNHSFVRSESIGRSGCPNLHIEALSISAFQCLTFKFLHSEPNPESPLNSFAAALWNNKEGQIHICHLLAILFIFYSCELRFEMFLLVMNAPNPPASCVKLFCTKLVLNTTRLLLLYSSYQIWAIWLWFLSIVFPICFVQCHWYSVVYSMLPHFICVDI